ncbi:hypothetical protein PSAL_005790 [Pseudooceanicola algae]|uniref:Uncharacterized protein n=1 Tax=Pseudooceanicola algae TaxID=1537215 RepID=A0A418SDA4_9RHOB|nr:hypothetical protein PSAL_005790 [Pseudooceanicola algae]
MLKRLGMEIAGHWFDIWSARAGRIASGWSRRSRRWAKKSEKFFHKASGGRR